MAHRTLIKSLEPWYREHLFVKHDRPTVIPAEKASIRNLDWKPSPKIRLTGCMLCAIRPIDRIAVPVGDGHLLELLGLTHLGDIKNRKLAQQLRELP